MALRWHFDFVSPYAYLHRQKLKALPVAVHRSRWTPIRRWHARNS
jgi:2-hydroxychromene-2-carboxylate isomerase